LNSIHRDKISQRPRFFTISGFAVAGLSMQRELPNIDLRNRSNFNDLEMLQSNPL